MHGTGKEIRTRPDPTGPVWPNFFSGHFELSAFDSFSFYYDISPNEAAEEHEERKDLAHA